MNKLKHLLTIFLFLLLIPVGVNAAGKLQEDQLELTFEDSGRTVCNDDKLVVPSYDNDGNVDGHLVCNVATDEATTKTTRLAVAYNVECTKYNLNNEKVWVTTDTDIYEKNVYMEMIYADNEQNITVSGNNDILVYQYSQDETITEPLWTAQYGGNSIDLGVALINSFDNTGTHDGYLLFAATLSTDIPNIMPGYVMVKYNLSGQKVWEKNTNELSTIILESGNNLVLVDEYIVEKSSQENGTVWSKELDVYINKIIQSKTKEGITDGYIVVGTGSGDAYNPNDIFSLNSDYISNANISNKTVIIKLDLNGNELWRSNLDEYTESAYYDVIMSRTPTGEFDGYIAVGMGSYRVDLRVDSYLTNKYFPAVGLIVKYDFDGNVVWQKEHTDKSTAFTTITENYNKKGEFNGYLIAGNFYEEPTATPQSSVKTPTPKKLQVSPLGLIPADACDTDQLIVKYTYKDYPIEKEVEKGGDVTVNTRAFPGETVEIKVSIEDGYVLESVIVVDEDGNELEIKNNTFTMPEGEVTVKAYFARLTNPETAAIGYIIVTIILIISIATFTVKNQKLQVTED